MSDLALSREELLAWADRTAEGWRDLGEKYPAMLELPCDIYTARSVGELLQHIVVIELRYAERLADRTPTAYNDVLFGTPAEIYATHLKAMHLLRERTADRSYDWELPIEFDTISLGRLRATRRTVFVHALMHGIRHYAQLATLLRQHGIKPGWPMDYMLMGAERI